MYHMNLVVNPSDELPIYRQIMRQITEAIAGGRLSPGDKLLSHRDLAEQLVVAPLTVKKAYDELESRGFIETQRGRGTFVRASLPSFDTRQHRDELRKAARKLLAQAYLGGLKLEDLQQILREADEELTEGARGPNQSLGTEAEDS